VRATDAAGNTVSRTFTVTQAPPVIQEAPAAPLGIYAMFGVAVAALGVGAYLLMFSRRGRGGQPMEIAGPEPGYMGGPGAEMAPAVDDTMVASPELSADAGGMTMDTGVPSPEAEVPAEVAGATLAPEAEVPAAPSRARPMRRRPNTSPEGGEGSTLTGMGAEDEAVPGESHQDQDETKEG